MHVQALSHSLADELVFNFAFWAPLHGVCTAVSPQERHFVDGQCLFYRKPLIDAGTDGSLGHVQVLLQPLRFYQYLGCLEKCVTNTPSIEIFIFSLLCSDSLFLGSSSCR